MNLSLVSSDFIILCLQSSQLFVQLHTIASGSTLNSIRHLSGVFLLIFLFQFLCQIRITHAVHIGNTVTNQLINLGMIKELQCRIQREPLLFSKAFNNTAIFFLKQNWIRCHNLQSLLRNHCSPFEYFSP